MLSKDMWFKLMMIRTWLLTCYLEKSYLKLICRHWWTSMIFQEGKYLIIEKLRSVFKKQKVL